MNATSNSKSSAHHIRVQLSDGSMESFTQSDEMKAKAIWDNLDPARLFGQKRLIIAGTHSKSVFVTAEIVRIDFPEPSEWRWSFPEGFFDVVELSEAQFRKRAHLDEPELRPRREDRTAAGGPLVSFLKLTFRSGPPIFLMVELSVKLPVENHSFVRFLLSKTVFCVRRSDGGLSIVNLAELTTYTAFPGVAQIPADALLAEPAETKPSREMIAR